MEAERFGLENENVHSGHMTTEERRKNNLATNINHFRFRAAWLTRLYRLP
jgi:hypothetical protein